MCAQETGLVGWPLAAASSRAPSPPMLACPQAPILRGEQELRPRSPNPFFPFGSPSTPHNSCCRPTEVLGPPGLAKLPHAGASPSCSLELPPSPLVPLPRLRGESRPLGQWAGLWRTGVTDRLTTGGGGSHSSFTFPLPRLLPPPSKGDATPGPPGPGDLQRPHRPHPQSHPPSPRQAGRTQAAGTAQWPWGLRPRACGRPQRDGRQHRRAARAPGPLSEGSPPTRRRVRKADSPGARGSGPGDSTWAAVAHGRGTWLSAR